MSPPAGRVSLSRAIILDAAFRVVDGAAMRDLTMSRLGRELGADPSAVYRHFRNKDELLLAMADVMLEETIVDWAEGGSPTDNLRRIAWLLRRAYLRRPGLARFVYYRFTGGEAEATATRAMVANMGALGFDDEAAVLHTRALAEMTLGHIAMTADSLTLPRQAQEAELSLAKAYYTFELQKPAARTTAQLHEAQLADGELVFDAMLETFIAGLIARAPAPARARRARSR